MKLVGWGKLWERFSFSLYSTVFCWTVRLLEFLGVVGLEHACLNYLSFISDNVISLLKEKTFNKKNNFISKKSNRTKFLNKIEVNLYLKSEGKPSLRPTDRLAFLLNNRLLSLQLEIIKIQRYHFYVPRSQICCR